MDRYQFFYLFFGINFQNQYNKIGHYCFESNNLENDINDKNNCNSSFNDNIYIKVVILQ